MRDKKARFANLTVSWISALICVSMSIASAGSPDTLDIVHISDTHICNLDGYHPRFVESQKHYGSGARVFAAFLKAIPGELNADALIITGDLIDFYEAETRRSEMLATQIEQFVTLTDPCPVPLYMTLGNRDITSYWVDEEDTTIDYLKHQIHAQKARATWIRTTPCFHNGTYYARDFAVGNTTFHFLFLDNGYSLHDGGRMIDKPQLDWLVHHVDKAGADPVVIFMHIYLSVGDKNGDGLFFRQRELDWPDDTSCSSGLLRVLNENRHIKALFVGHGHKNVIEKIDFPAGHDIYQCETGGFGDKPDNWRLLRFTDKSIVVCEPGVRRAERIISLSE